MKQLTLVLGIIAALLWNPTPSRAYDESVFFLKGPTWVWNEDQNKDFFMRCQSFRIVINHESRLIKDKTHWLMEHSWGFRVWVPDENMTQDANKSHCWWASVWHHHGYFTTFWEAATFMAAGNQAYVPGLLTAINPQQYGIEPKRATHEQIKSVMLAHFWDSFRLETSMICDSNFMDGPARYIYQVIRFCLPAATGMMIDDIIKQLVDADHVTFAQGEEDAPILRADIKRLQRLLPQIIKDGTLAFLLKNG